MPLSGRYRAVVFDMDGLLLDTETLWHEAEIELFERHGGEFTWDDKLAVIGTSHDFTARYFAQRLGEPHERGAALVDEMISLMHERVRQEVHARPGAVELMKGLREMGDVRVGLASNSPRTLVDAALASGVGVFVYPSFAPVYADGGTRWLSAGAPVDPTDVLESTLVAEDEVLRFATAAATAGGRGIVLRMSGVYGPHSSATRDVLALARRGVSAFARPAAAD